MWVCECGNIPEVVNDLGSCELCRQPDSFDWIEECDLDQCVYATDANHLCTECFLKVGVQRGFIQ